MPFVNIKTVRGILTDEQKSELKDKISDLMVEYEGGGNPKFRRNVWVLLEEHGAESWSLSGHTPHPEMVKQLYGGSHAQG